MAGKTKTTDAQVEAADEIYRVAQEPLKAELADLKEKQARIAETHEVVGRIQGLTFIGKVATVGNLVQLKKIKDSKTYRDLPGLGTWEEFCNYIGLSRQKVDEDLGNLAAFGEDFLTTCQQFSLGYREMRKLKQLTHDGSVIIEAEAVVIGDERIPLDAEHKEELQDAIEMIVSNKIAALEDAQATLKAKDKVLQAKEDVIKKQEKELSKFEKTAIAKGLTPEEDALLSQVEAHRIFAQGSLIALEPQEIFAAIADPSPRMRAAVISTVHFLKMQILALYDTVVTEVGNPVMNPELLEEYERWEAESSAQGQR